MKIFIEQIERYPFYVVHLRSEDGYDDTSEHEIVEADAISIIFIQQEMDKLQKQLSELYHK